MTRARPCDRRRCSPSRACSSSRCPSCASPTRRGSPRRAGRARAAGARAGRGARSCAGGAEGARVRPPHRQGLGRRLPGARRPAARSASRRRCGRWSRGAVDRGASPCRGLSARPAGPSCPGTQVLPCVRRGRCPRRHGRPGGAADGARAGPVEPHVSERQLFGVAPSSVAAGARSRRRHPRDRAPGDRELALGADRARDRALPVHRLPRADRAFRTRPRRSGPHLARRAHERSNPSRRRGRDDRRSRQRAGSSLPGSGETSSLSQRSVASECGRWVRPSTPRTTAPQRIRKPESRRLTTR